MIEYTPDQQRAAWDALKSRGSLRDYPQAFDPERLKRDNYVRALVRFECAHQVRLAEQRMRIPAVQRRRVTPWDGVDLKRRASGDKDD